VADVSTARLAWAVRQVWSRAARSRTTEAALAHVDRSGHRHVGGHALRNRPRGPGRRAALLHREAARPNSRGRARARSRGKGRRTARAGRHIFRFHPVTATLREALRPGRIGRVRYATGRFSGFKRPRADVGVTQTDAIHYFDSVRVSPRLRAHGSARFSATIWARPRRSVLDGRALRRIPAWSRPSYFVPGTWRYCVIVGERGALVATTQPPSSRFTWASIGAGRGLGAVEAGKAGASDAARGALQSSCQSFLDACSGRAPNPCPSHACVRSPWSRRRPAAIGRTRRV